MVPFTFFAMVFISYCVLAAVSRTDHTILVDQFGNGHYRNIQEAIDSIPSNNKHYVTISIMPGIYKGVVTLPPDKPFITISSSTYTTSDVVLTWDQCGDIDKVATIHVMASDFIARNITFRNTYGPGTQAVALRVSGDRIAFYGCSMLGYQDTLFDEIGIHYYENCYIQGAIDFIFGSGTSMFQDCHVHSVGGGYITAQRRMTPEEHGGFIFAKGRITGKDKTYLGRPWEGLYARVVFVCTYMESLIEPQGWGHFNDVSEKDLTSSFCGQYKCDGPGAVTSRRVKWAREFSDAEVVPFFTRDFIGGKYWLKSITTTALSPPSPPPSRNNDKKKPPSSEKHKSKMSPFSPLSPTNYPLPPSPVIPPPPQAQMTHPVPNPREEIITARDPPPPGGGAAESDKPIIMVYSSGGSSSMSVDFFSSIKIFAIFLAVLLHLVA